MKLLYSTIHYLAMPLIMARYLYKAKRNPDYAKRTKERFGIFKPCNDHKTIWIHAVSVGETIASAPLVKKLLNELPDYKIIFTTRTPTGSEQANRLFGNSVFHVYAPHDLPGSVKRFLKRTNPRVAIIVETELWPNLFYYTHKNHTPILVANARLSKRSMEGYNKIAKLTQKMLQDTQMVAAQSKNDLNNFIQLGLDPNKGVTTGSIKFDIEIPNHLINESQQLREQWHALNRPVWIAASTHATEEEIILEAHKTILKAHPNTLLILVPRHPERFEKVTELSEQTGLKTVRYSNPSLIDSETQIIVGDVMGKLLLLYGISDIAFVGGSFNQTGGHNPLEPAALAKPVLTGPQVFNFSEISQLLQDDHAEIVVHDATELASAVNDLISNSETRIKMGKNALHVVSNNRGALRKHLDLIKQMLNLNSPT